MPEEALEDILTKAKNEAIQQLTEQDGSENVGILEALAKEAESNIVRLNAGIESLGDKSSETPASSIIQLLEKELLCNTELKTALENPGRPSPSPAIRGEQIFKALDSLSTAEVKTVVELDRLITESEKESSSTLSSSSSEENSSSKDSPATKGTSLKSIRAGYDNIIGAMQHLSSEHLTAVTHVVGQTGISTAATAATATAATTAVTYLFGATATAGLIAASGGFAKPAVAAGLAVAKVATSVAKVLETASPETATPGAEEEAAAAAPPPVVPPKPGAAPPPAPPAEAESGAAAAAPPPPPTADAGKANDKSKQKESHFPYMREKLYAFGSGSKSALGYLGSGAINGLAFGASVAIGGVGGGLQQSARRGVQGVGRGLTYSVGVPLAGLFGGVVGGVMGVGTAGSEFMKVINERANNSYNSSFWGNNKSDHIKFAAAVVAGTELLLRSPGELLYQIGDKGGKGALAGLEGAVSTVANYGAGASDYAANYINSFSKLENAIADLKVQKDQLEALNVSAEKAYISPKTGDGSKGDWALKIKQQQLVVEKAESRVENFHNLSNRVSGVVDFFGGNKTQLAKETDLLEAQTELLNALAREDANYTDNVSDQYQPPKKYEALIKKVVKAEKNIKKDYKEPDSAREVVVKAQSDRKAAIDKVQNIVEAAKKKADDEKALEKKNAAELAAAKANIDNAGVPSKPVGDPVSVLQTPEQIKAEEKRVAALPITQIKEKFTESDGYKPLETPQHPGGKSFSMKVGDTENAITLDLNDQAAGSITILKSEWDEQADSDKNKALAKATANSMHKAGWDYADFKSKGKNGVSEANAILIYQKMKELNSEFKMTFNGNDVAKLIEKKDENKSATGRKRTEPIKPELDEHAQFVKNVQDKIKSSPSFKKMEDFSTSTSTQIPKMCMSGAIRKAIIEQSIEQNATDIALDDKGLIKIKGKKEGDSITITITKYDMNQMIANFNPAPASFADSSITSDSSNLTDSIYPSALKSPDPVTAPDPSRNNEIFLEVSNKITNEFKETVQRSKQSAPINTEDNSHEKTQSRTRAVSM